MKRVLSTVIGILIAGTTFAAATNRVVRSRIVRSTDNSCEIALFEGWTSGGSHTRATLQISKPDESMWLIVLVEDKEDLRDPSLEKYFGIIQKQMLKRVEDAKSSDAATMSINGHSAMQSQIKGFVDDYKVVYLLTVVEGETHYYQMIAWTSATKFAKNE